MTITYRFTLDGPFDGLRELSESLYEHELLLSESRSRVEQLVHAIHTAIERPKIAAEVEDYLIFSIESCVPAQGSPYGPAGRRHWPASYAASARPSRSKKFVMHCPAAFLSALKMRR